MEEEANVLIMPPLFFLGLNSVCRFALRWLSRSFIAFLLIENLFGLIFRHSAAKSTITVVLFIGPDMPQ